MMDIQEIKALLARTKIPAQYHHPMAEALASIFTPEDIFIIEDSFNDFLSVTLSLVPTNQQALLRSDLRLEKLEESPVILALKGYADRDLLSAHSYSDRHDKNIEKNVSALKKLLRRFHTPRDIFFEKLSFCKQFLLSHDLVLSDTHYALLTLLLSDNDYQFKTLQSRLEKTLKLNHPQQDVASLLDAVDLISLSKMIHQNPERWICLKKIIYNRLDQGVSAKNEMRTDLNLIAINISTLAHSDTFLDHLNPTFSQFKKELLLAQYGEDAFEYGLITKRARSFINDSIDAETFKASLAIDDDEIKNHDLMPCIEIKKQIQSGPLKGNYHLHKLEAGDYRGFYLGNLIGCCQSMGDYAEECAIDGMILETHGFYVLEKDGKIIAQAYAWLSNEDNFVFDSLEILMKGGQGSSIYKNIAKEIFTQSAQEIAKTYSKVFVGRGGGTYQVLGIDHLGLITHDESHSIDRPKEAGNRVSDDSSYQKLLAVSPSFLEELQALKGDQRNNPDQYGISPLNYLIKFGTTEQIETFLTQKVDFAPSNLESALEAGKFDLFYSLLAQLESNHPNLLDEYQNDSGQSLLHLAAKIGNIEIFNCIAPKVNLDLIDNSGNTALHYAVLNDQIALIAELKELTHSFQVINSSGMTPVDLAAALGHKDLVTYFIEHVDAHEFLPNYKETALIQAAHYGKKNIVAMLLNHAAQIDHPDEYGDSALIHAAEEGHVDTTRLLIDKGASLNITNHRGQSALFVAAEDAHLEIVQLFLEQALEPSLLDAKMSSLMEAAKEGPLILLKCFLEQNIPLQPYLNSRESALFMAVSWFKLDLDMIDGLLADGVDINSCNAIGDTLLHKAMEFDNIELATYLLKNNIAQDIINHRGESALSSAVKLFRLNMLDLLLENNPTLNMKYQEGNTLLNMAIESNNFFLAYKFLEYGADPTIPNDKNQTALSLLDDMAKTAPPTQLWFQELIVHAKHKANLLHGEESHTQFMPSLNASMLFTTQSSTRTETKSSKPN